MLDPRHYDMARRLARRYKIAGMSRDDVEQEALLSILESLQAGTSDDSHVYNDARNHLRVLAKRNSPELLGDDDTHVADPHGDDGTRAIDDADEYDARIAPYLDIITSRQAEILRLEFVEGLSQEDVASRLGVSLRSVQVARSKALAKIRDAEANKK